MYSSDQIVGYNSRAHRAHDDRNPGPSCSRYRDRQLQVLHAKYRGKDDLDPQELARDFILGCCPEITVEMAHEYLHKTRQLVLEQGIAFDCSNIGAPVTV